MAPFLEGLKRIVAHHKVNLVNAGMRVVHQDDIAVLSYAPEDCFAFVLYFNQKIEPKESQRLEAATQDLIDLVIALKGRFYLPYQLYYSKAQLQKAYPSTDYFFAMKKKYDPNELFTNKFYEKYGK